MACCNAKYMAIMTRKFWCYCSSTSDTTAPNKISSSPGSVVSRRCDVLGDTTSGFFNLLFIRKGATSVRLSFLVGTNHKFILYIFEQISEQRTSNFKGTPSTTLRNVCVRLLIAAIYLRVMFQQLRTGNTPNLSLVRIRGIAEPGNDNSGLAISPSPRYTKAVHKQQSRLKFHLN